MRKEPLHHHTNYRVGFVQDDYFNLSGELMVAKGASGLIVCDDRGRLTLCFDADDSGKHVALDGGGRKTQMVPTSIVKQVSTAIKPSFEHTVDNYQFVLLGHLLNYGEQAALLVNDDLAIVLMDNNQGVGYLPINEVGYQEPTAFVHSDWNTDVGNWHGFKSAHTLAFQALELMSIEELVEQNNYTQPPPSPRP